MSKRFGLGLAAAVLLTAGAASAVDAKLYVGSMCSFADNPTAPHHKIHHTFTSTGAALQWVTCPLVRDLTTQGIESAAMETLGGQDFRLEARSADLGGLSGWVPNVVQFPGAGMRNVWASGSATISPPANAALTMEVRLHQDASVWMYRLEELD
jgi:hypothetical protein